MQYFQIVDDNLSTLNEFFTESGTFSFTHLDFTLLSPYTIFFVASYSENSQFNFIHKTISFSFDDQYDSDINETLINTMLII